MFGWDSRVRNIATLLFVLIMDTLAASQLLTPESSVVCAGVPVQECQCNQGSMHVVKH